MNMTSMKKLLSVMVCIVLIAALAIVTTGCGNTPAQTTAPSSPTADATVLGEGEKVFSFTIIDTEGVSTAYEIHTDAEVVGQALLELGLIDGEEGPYGLYVKTVGGQTLDYDTDKMYWSFYVNGEYGLTGVDQTPIAEGESYEFRAEAG